MRALDSGYAMEVDSVDKQRWHSLLLEFDDASFYQTWSYGSVQWGDRQLSHLILKHEDRVVAMAQLRIVGIRVLRIGTAYLNWGPIWRLKAKPTSLLHFRNMVRALRAEYAVRCGYLLRLLPRVPANSESEEIRRVIEQEGYVWAPDSLETVILDLSPSLTDLRKGLHKSWRESLRFAERQGLEVIEDGGTDSCQIALRIADEMRMRKQFYGSGQPTAVAVHMDLPDSLKLRICICRHDGEPVAALGWTTIGRVGLILIAATCGRARELKAAFLLWWKMVEYYKAHGFATVDLAGVSEERNPGGYFFKSGLAGRNFKEPNRFIGQFDTCVNPRSALASRTAYALNNGRKRIMYRFTKLVKSLKPAEKPSAAVTGEEAGAPSSSSPSDSKSD